MGIMLVKAKEKVGTGTHKKENLEKERRRKNEKSGKKGRSERERGKRERRTEERVLVGRGEDLEAARVGAAPEPAPAGALNGGSDGVHLLLERCGQQSAYCSCATYRWKGGSAKGGCERETPRVTGKGPSVFALRDRA